jgi:hypothetical protein
MGVETKPRCKSEWIDQDHDLAFDAASDPASRLLVTRSSRADPIMASESRLQAVAIS